MKPDLVSLVLVSLQTAVFADGKVFNSFDELPNKSYDFVVVGGGTSGAALASRLTENSRFSVLVVEAGSNNEGVIELQVPGLWQEIPQTYFWNYTTTPQASLNGRSIEINKGYVLGGTSAISGGVWQRGSSEDYDTWARITGDSGWSWKSVLKYAKKSERWTPPVGGRNITGQYDPKVHGFNGPNRVSLRQYPARIFDERVSQAAAELDEFSTILDANSGNPVGLSWTQVSSGNGEKSNSAVSYLPTAVRKRSNLDIVLNTRATKVLRSGSGKHLDVRTVELAHRSGSGSTRKTLTAKKELILSAGSINTPQLLQLSGIGEGRMLRTLGITPLHELPDVGKGISDSTVSPVAFWRTNEPAHPPIDPEAALAEWIASRTGPYVDLPATQQTLNIRIPKNANIWRNESDPAAGKNTPHLELYFVDNGSIVGAVVILLTPKSRGTITLRSSNPFDPPLINSGHLSHPFDLEAIREGARSLHRLFAALAWQSSVVAPVTPLPDAPGFEIAVRNSTISTGHFVGAAVMTKKGSKFGVVDPDFKVKGIRGLRIVDESVVPRPPAGHSPAIGLILAERAADLIKGDW